MAASVDNYYIGKGIVSTSTDSGTTWIDIGNAPEFELTPKITKLDHFSSRLGVKTKDKSVVLQKEATLKVTLEEWTLENLAIALLGTITTGTLSIFEVSSVDVQVKLVGANDVGNQFTVILPNVSFIPSQGLKFIGDTWGQIELEGEVLDNGAGSFGTITMA